MPRVDPLELEEPGDRELARVFIAATMVEAKQAEAVLTAQRGAVRRGRGADRAHAVRVSPNAAVFYVAATDADACTSILVDNGLEFGIVKD